MAFEPLSHPTEDFWAVGVVQKYLFFIIGSFEQLEEEGDECQRILMMAME